MCQRGDAGGWPERRPRRLPERSPVQIRLPANCEELTEAQKDEIRSMLECTVIGVVPVPGFDYNEERR